MNSNLERYGNEDFEQINISSTREITWKIRGFKFLPRSENYSLDSPPFDFENATWCLRLYTNNKYTSEGSMYDGYTYLGFTIVRLSSRVPHHRLRYNLIWPDEYFGNHSMTHEFDEDHKENGDRYFVERSYPVRYTTAIDETRTLKLMCQISLCGSPAVDAFVQTEWNTKVADNGDLCQNLKNLLLNGEDHDLVLRVKDKEFRAHQTILRARSPVFESMLSHDMIEKNSGLVDIPDCDPGAFQQFLLYVYGGEVEKLDSGNVLALYYVADKYDKEHLKELCRQFMKESLTPANVSDVIQLAMDHSDADLLECATEYFVKHVRAVLRTVEWQSFSKRNNTQANELFIKAADKLHDGTT